MASLAGLWRLVVSVGFSGLVIAAGMAPTAALAYGTCDSPEFKIDTNWFVPLWDGDCSRYNGAFNSRSEALGDGSRGERFEVTTMGADGLQATINSTDFAPDVYIYDDDAFSHEIGQFQRSDTQARSTVRLQRGPGADALNVYYVLATSFGPGARFGKYTLDLRTC